jgi:putative chitinase
MAAEILTTRLTEALDRVGARDPAGWTPVLAKACAAHGIDTPRRLAAFIANIMVETGGLSTLVESMNYAPDGLVKTFGTARIDLATAQKLGRVPPRPANQEAIANHVYGGSWGKANLSNTEPGDGWRFRGRGLIQLTGRANYTRFAKEIGVALDDLPALLETRAGAAESAAHFFQAAGCNDAADSDDIEKARRRVNAAGLEMAKVKDHYATAKAVLER